jgi:hypothetical protein
LLIHSILEADGIVVLKPDSVPIDEGSLSRPGATARAMVCLNKNAAAALSRLHSNVHDIWPDDRATKLPAATLPLSLHNFPAEAAADISQ